MTASKKAPPSVGRPPKTKADMVKGEKSCTRCGKTFPFRRFSKLAHGIGGVHSTCKMCRSAQVRRARQIYLSGSADD